MAARPLRGYRLIPGSARRYRTPSGEVISRREYDNRRARAAGWKNRYELEKFRRTAMGSDWTGDIYAHQGRGPTWEEYRDMYEVKKRRAELRRKHGDLRHSELDVYDPELVAADGPLARLLDAAGKRPVTGRPVGAS